MRDEGKFLLRRFVSLLSPTISIIRAMISKGRMDDIASAPDARVQFLKTLVKFLLTNCGVSTCQLLTASIRSNQRLTET